MMSKQKIGIWLLAFSIGCLFIWFVTTQGPLAPIKVTVAKLQSSDLSNSVFGVGTLKARHSYNLAPTLVGRVKNILVDQGDRVVAGQLLVEMDPVDLTEKLTASQRAIEKLSYSIQSASAQRQELQSRQQLSTATFNRYQELHDKGFISAEMLAAKQHEKTAATASEEAANANLAAMREDLSRAQAEMRGIQKLNTQTKLFSPINGVIAARFAEPGGTLSGGQIALQIIDPHSIWIETRIAQNLMGAIHTELPAAITLRSQPNFPLAGKVARVDLISDAITEEGIVNINFIQAPANVRLGEYAEIVIQLPTLKQVASLPSAAIKRIDKQEGVWVLKDGSAQFIAVKTGAKSLDGHTQILSGISPNETVIVYSQQALNPGARVKTVAELVRGKP
jgi:RND family efflux transporter MFP subunit